MAWTDRRHNVEVGRRPGHECKPRHVDGHHVSSFSSSSFFSWVCVCVCVMRPRALGDEGEPFNVNHLKMLCVVSRLERSGLSRRPKRRWWATVFILIFSFNVIWRRRRHAPLTHSLNERRDERRYIWAQSVRLTDSMHFDRKEKKRKENVSRLGSAWPPMVLDAGGKWWGLYH